jgi:hypothetical protein
MAVSVILSTPIPETQKFVDSVSVKVPPAANEVPAAFETA